MNVASVQFEQTARARDSGCFSLMVIFVVLPYLGAPTLTRYSCTFMHFHDLSEVRQSNHRAWWHWRHGVAVLPGQKRPLEQSFEPSGGGHRVLGAGTHRVQLQCLGCLVVTVCHCSPSLFQDDQLWPWCTMINCKSTPFFGDAEKLQQSRINTSQIQVVETSISFLFRVAQMPIF